MKLTMHSIAMYMQISRDLNDKYLIMSMISRHETESTAIVLQPNHVINLYRVYQKRR